MHCGYQRTLVITITVHQFTIHANIMVGEFHFMMQIQSLKTGILFDQRLFLPFSEGKPLFCPFSPSAGTDPHNSARAREFLLIYTRCSFTLTKIKRGDINSQCSQSRTLFTSRMAKGVLGIKPMGRQQGI